MARLPSVGSDDGNWGTLLNDFLSQEHNADGTLKNAVRKNDLVLNVLDFGAKGDGTTNDSAAIQSALDSATATGKSVYLPKATYIADGLLVRTKVKLFGDGMESSIIKAPSGSGNDAVFLLDHGNTQYWRMEDISIWGNGNANQHGMHFYARRTGSDTASGLWNSQFIRVQVYNFEKAAMWL